MTDLTLFPELQPDEKPCQGIWDTKAHHHGSDPETSAQAALDAMNVSQKHCAIIRGILACDLQGLTTREIELNLQFSSHPLEYIQIVRRMSDLAKSGLVEDSGLRRKNPNGREAVVWRVKG